MMIPARVRLFFVLKWGIFRGRDALQCVSTAEVLFFYTTRMHDEESETREIHGKKILYRRENERSVEYLDDLDHDEWDVISEYAERHREAKFRDDRGRKMVLIRQDHDDYVLERR